MTREDLAQNVKDFLILKTDALKEWYVGCVWCDETRYNMNRDLDSILRDAEKKFGLKKFRRNLRVRMMADQPGMVRILWEDPTSN